jgi:hypothetical protein
MRRGPRNSAGLLAARVFRPPVPVEVITRPSRDNEPGEIQIEAIKGEGDLAGEVRTSSGPWHVEHAWWTSTPAERAYWDVELMRGNTYRMYRDGEGWFVEAGYD